MHVDDFIWAGTDDFETGVIQKVRSAFRCGKEEEKSFKYIGLNIEHSEDGIILQQHGYSSDMKMLNISELRSMRSNDDLSDTERTSLREVSGQLNWLSNQSRPDLSYDVLEMSMSVKKAQVSHLKQANKVIKKAKFEDTFIRFPKLGDPNELRLVLFSDASYANLCDGVSSAEGYILFLVDSNGRCSPLAWCSRGGIPGGRTCASEASNAKILVS